MNEMNAIPISGYVRTIGEMRHGRSLIELSELLAELVQKVREFGKEGSLTYKLIIKPASAGDSVTVQLDDDIKFNPPRPARASSIFFANEDNTLQRSDPRQREFEIREVPKDTKVTITQELAPAAIYG